MSRLSSNSSDDLSGRRHEQLPRRDFADESANGVCKSNISHLGRASADLVPTFVQHLALALSGHLYRMHHSGLPVPREIEELANYLATSARNRQDPTSPAPDDWNQHHAPVMNRLLLTKSEVAEQLSVSERTVERLVAAGRLTQVYVEHSARIRVKDLERFVESLAQSPGCQ